MSDLRKEQNERRKESGEPITRESMLLDLAEEATDPRTPEERKTELRDLFGLLREFGKLDRELAGMQRRKP